MVTPHIFIIIAKLLIGQPRSSSVPIDLIFMYILYVVFSKTTENLEYNLCEDMVEVHNTSPGDDYASVLPSYNN